MLSYFIIILVCITLVGSVSFYISYTTMAKQAESASLLLVQQIEKNMDNDFHSKRNLLLAAYNEQSYIDGINLYPELSDRERFQFRQRIGDLYLKSFNVTPIRDFIRFQIYYSTGELLSSSDGSGLRDASQVSHAEWFRSTVAKDGEVFFSGYIPEAERADGDEAAYFSAIMIRDFSNPVRFMIVRAEYRSEIFNSIGRNEGLSEHSSILILDEGNRVVYASGDSHAYASEPALMDLINGNRGRFWNDTAGGEQLVSYMRSGYSGWKAVLVIPKADIFGSLDVIKSTVIWTAVSAFVITLIISFLFGQRITKPILHLYKSVNRIKRGDFSARVEVKRLDEIGRIAMNFNAMQEELRQLIETRYVNQIKLQEAELAMLYSQINPHFLYNTLDSIRAMSDYYQVKEISGMAESLADIFRYNTKNKNEVVTLQEELVQIDAYMSIQKIRFEDKIHYDQQIGEELVGLPLLKMTLQPLVENAVFHGIERKRGKGTITTAARQEDEFIVLTVKDDGVGIPDKRLAGIRASLRPPLLQAGHELNEARMGIGIQNVYSRYALRCGPRFQFRIDSKEGAGTEITLLIPIDKLADSEKSEFLTKQVEIMNRP
ncbi:sensor histidine kinase [Paenibacillus sp. N4]|uniref:cache domain-containing sensor histidine kinase n=1 Tax=Paenibacillus vietnamensis TaxID=2590547 RepID=UPI001CD0AE90|nr:sensor histidine kinase [Paenibacillus vietnamensis]MCA0755717.1 sensor histidine kinase [Paenibacillus vietnamensis]